MEVLSSRNFFFNSYSSKQKEYYSPFKKNIRQNLIIKGEELQGDIIRNGSFEFWVEPTKPYYWKGSNIISSSCRHTGVGAVQLGKTGYISCHYEKYRGENICSEHLPAFLFQDVEIDSGNVLALKFFISLYITREAVEECHRKIQSPLIEVRLTWLAKDGRELGTGICLHIPEGTLGPGWSVYQDVSSKPPLNAKKIRLSFAKAEGWPILIDDVSLLIKK